MSSSHTREGHEFYVPVRLIRVNHRKLRKLSAAKILSYVACYEAGDNFPPISVNDCGGYYDIRDGRHRFQAQLACGFSLIAVSVTTT